MYRTASYYKVREFEQLQVCVFDSPAQEQLVLRIIVDFRCGLLKAFVIEPLTYLGHSFNHQCDELRRVQNFIDERGWRNKCRDFNLITSSVL